MMPCLLILVGYKVEQSFIMMSQPLPGGYSAVALKEHIVSPQGNLVGAPGTVLSTT